MYCSGGGVPRHIKKGDLMHGHGPQNGVLGTDTSRKRGSKERAKLEQKRGLKNWSCKQEDISN